MREDYPDVTFPDVYPFSKNVDELLNTKFWEKLTDKESEQDSD